MKIEINDEAVDGVVAQALDQQIKAIKSNIKNLKNDGLSKKELENEYVLLNAMQIIKNYYSITQ